MLVGTLVLAGFTTFYLAQQRSIRRHQQELAASQALRAALEQVSRDLRTAGLDPSTTAAAGITLADTDEVDFTRDADASGAINTSDASESLRFRRNGPALESYVAGGVASWLPIADSVVETSPTFRYYRCDGTEITTLPANATDRAAISRIDVSLAVDGSGGIQFVRRETESVHLRNKVCS